MNIDLELKMQIAFIAIAFLLLIILMSITKKITRKVSLVKKLEPHRKKVVLNMFYFVYYLIFIISVILILGIDLSFLASILAILGVAFVAQWSLLSNITASVIIFFYHPLKIGDKVKILDKELDFSGTVKNITGFYVLIETDTKQQITIPTTHIQVD